jgi:hypothetical protein
VAIHDYINCLSNEELDAYIELASNFYDWRTLGDKSIKVTLNAVKLCVKLSECGYKTFPYIERVATKGWDTSGGTYSFSIPLLTAYHNNTDIYSYCQIKDLIKESVKLDVCYSESRRAIEIDIQ